MTKKDKISYLLMAPLLLASAGAFIYALTMLTTMHPLGLLTLAVVAAFVIGFVRIME
jgi:undecaprenyl pyrophosphate phosphatase UppP